MVIWSAYLSTMRHYAVFEGRSSRSQLFGYAACLVLILLIAAIGDRILARDHGSDLMLSIAIAAHVVPTLAISVRRVHDIDAPAAVLLIGVIPYVGWIILFLLAISPTTPGTNKYDVGTPKVPASSHAVPRLNLLDLGRRVARLRRSLFGGYSSPSRFEPPPLPEPPASLAIELGLDSGALPPKQPDDTLSKRLRLEALRKDGMLSEAEFIRLVRELK